MVVFVARLLMIDAFSAAAVSTATASNVSSTTVDAVTQTAQQSLLADIEMGGTFFSIITLFLLGAYMGRAFSWAGPLICAIQELLIRDFAKVVAIMSGFCVMMVALRRVTYTSTGECSNIARSLWTELFIMVGNGGCDSGAMTARSKAVEHMWVDGAQPFFITIIFVLSNILIGMFSATYEEILSRSDEFLNFSRAQIVCAVAGHKKNTERWMEFMKNSPAYICDDGGGHTKITQGADAAGDEKKRWFIIFTKRLDGEAEL
jgi:hypothetical protein